MNFTNMIEISYSVRLIDIDELNRRLFGKLKMLTKNNCGIFQNVVCRQMLVFFSTNNKYFARNLTVI